MLRRIIRIDEELCNGCKACVDACHEHAIEIVDGKARLLRDDYCDGLGDCLPACPAGAIFFEEREAAPYDDAAVQAHIQKQNVDNATACFCPGTEIKTFDLTSRQTPTAQGHTSQLRQWPVQIKLVPQQAPYFNDAHLLIAADCAAYACGDFHKRFMNGKVTLIGCPKLDAGDYTVKLAEIFRHNNIKSILLTRMQVPCCGGMEQAVVRAITASGKDIPLEIITISHNGHTID